MLHLQSTTMHRSTVAVIVIVVVVVGGDSDGGYVVVVRRSGHSTRVHRVGLPTTRHAQDLSHEGNISPVLVPQLHQSVSVDLRKYMVNHSITQSLTHSINQSINQLINQSVFIATCQVKYTYTWNEA